MTAGIVLIKISGAKEKLPVARLAVEKINYRLVVKGKFHEFDSV